MTEEESQNTLTLLVPGADGKAEKFIVPAEVIVPMSDTIRGLVEDLGDADLIPLPNMSPDSMATVIEYCTAHTQQPRAARTEEVHAWDQEFLQRLDNREKLSIMVAANYLNIASLIDLLCTDIAMGIKACTTTEEIRQKFDIVNDFTPEEEEQIKKESAWAFE